MASGDSFLAVVYDTQKHRDSAIRKLQTKECTIEAKAVTLMIHPFGQARSQQSNLWVILAGPLDTPEELAAGVTALLGETQILI